jgi:ubiquinone/menaquinone biosynthesis C-methylase UbiE
MAPRKSELYFEEIGDRFDRWASPYDVRQRRRMIRDLMPRNARFMTCLEVGCGRGAISQAIAPLVGTLTVADISGRMACEVGKRLGIEWREDDACGMTAADESFDMVVSSECIEHTVDPRRALSEMVRVVRKNGTIIVTSPNKLWFPVVWLSMKTGMRKFSGNERWLFPHEAFRTMQRHGIGSMTMTGCHLLPWQLPFAKSVLPYFDRFGRMLYPFMINYGVAGIRER